MPERSAPTSLDIVIPLFHEEESSTAAAPRGPAPGGAAVDAPPGDRADSATADGPLAPGGRATSASPVTTTSTWRRFVRDHGMFLLVLGAIVALRVWFTFAYPVAHRSDYLSYYREAQSMAGLRPPAYEAMMSNGPKILYSIPFRLFGSSYTVIGLTNTVLYAMGIVFAYLGARRAFGAATATVTAIVGFTSLSEVYFTNLTCTELPGSCLMSLLFWLMVRGDGSRRAALLLGLSATAAVYNRPNLLHVAGLVFVHRCLVTRTWREPLRTALIVQAVILVLALPLCVWNLKHFGRFTPLNANMMAFWAGNNPTMKGDFHVTPDMPEYHPPGSARRAELVELYRDVWVNPDAQMQFQKMGEYEVDDVLARYAMAYIRKNPRRFLHLVVARFQLFFFSCTYGEAPYRQYDPTQPDQPRWRPAHRRLIETVRLPVRRWYQVLISGAALGLLVTLWNDRRRLLPHRILPLLMIAYYVIPFLLTMGANRYHIPILNLAWMYLAHGLVTLLRRLRGTAPSTA